MNKLMNYNNMTPQETLQQIRNKNKTPNRDVRSALEAIRSKKTKEPSLTDKTISDIGARSQELGTMNVDTPKSGLVKTFGSVSGIATANITDALTPDFVKKGIDWARQATDVSDNPLVQKAALATADFANKQLEPYRAMPAEYRNIVEGVSEFAANAFPVAAAPRQGLNLTRKVTGSLERATADAYKTVTGTEITPEIAQANVKSRLTEQLYGKKTNTNALDKANTDIVDTIAKDPRYLPEVNAETKQFKADDAIANIESDISTKSGTLKTLFDSLDNEYGGVNLSNMSKAISETVFSDKNKALRSQIGDGPFDQITKSIEDVRKLYGESVPRNELWKIRQAVDSTVEALSDSNAKRTLREDLRTAYADVLNKSVPNSETLVKRSMEDLSGLIEAKNFLRDKVSGSAIQGGRLTDIVRNALGSQVGSFVGGSIGAGLGSVPGAVVGYMASQKIGKWLAGRSIITPSEAKALSKLRVEQPKVWEEVKAMTKDFGGEKAANLSKAIDAGDNYLDEINTRIKESGAKKLPAEVKAVVELNKKFFGDKDINFVNNIDKEKDALGYYGDGIINIVLEKGDMTDTYHHEAVHKYMDVLTTPKEKDLIMKFAENKYKDDVRAKDQDIEELIAEDFIKYAKDKSLVSGGIKLVFERIIDRVKKLLGGEDKIKTMYDSLLTGKSAQKAKSAPTEDVKYRKSLGSIAAIANDLGMGSKVFNSAIDRINNSKQFWGRTEAIRDKVKQDTTDLIARLKKDATDEDVEEGSSMINNMIKNYGLPEEIANILYQPDDVAMVLENVLKKPTKLKS